MTNSNQDGYDVEETAMFDPVSAPENNYAEAPAFSEAPAYDPKPTKPAKFDYAAIAKEFALVALITGMGAGLVLALIDQLLMFGWQSTGNDYTGLGSVGSYVALGVMCALVVCAGVGVYLLIDNVADDGTVYQEIDDDRQKLWKTTWVVLPLLTCAVLVLVTLNTNMPLLTTLLLIAVILVACLATYSVVPGRVEKRRLYR